VRVIKDRQVSEDSWQRLADDQPLSDGDVIISYRRWREQGEDIAAHQGGLTICIDGDDDIDEVAAVAGQFAMIAVDFPSFRDGRCYSQACLLRERHGYRGEIRAVGDVLRDQLLYMSRCGIDAFVVRADRDAEDALKAFDELKVHYQAGADGEGPISRYR